MLIIGFAKLIILPYQEVGEFFAEYEHYCDEYKFDDDTRASKATFRRAMNIYRKKHKEEVTLRFSRCKGHFQTCEVCNKADDLLRNTRMTLAQKDVFRAVKSIHIAQEKQERVHLEKMRQMCREKDEKGQPKMAMLFSDGMTIYTTNTPKMFQKNSKGEPLKKIQSRMVGMEVVCGDISTMFMYYTDNLVRGGSNIILEITRQGLYDLQKLLAEKGQIMPEKLVLQFDNCGENKVITSNFTIKFHCFVLYLSCIEFVFE